MKRVFFAAALLFTLPGMTAAAPLPRQVFARECQKPDIMPEIEELDLWDDGSLMWNGRPTDWGRLPVKLDDFFKSPGVGRKYLLVVGSLPQKTRAILAKERFVPKNCPHPAIQD